MSEQPEQAETPENAANCRVWSDNHRGGLQVILALLAAKTVKDAAAAGGVCERTVRTWKQDAGFQAELREMRDEFIERGYAELLLMLSEAMAALRRLLTSTNDAASLGAAKEVAAAVLRLRSELDIGPRLARIEAMVAGLGVKLPE